MTFLPDHGKLSFWTESVFFFQLDSLQKLNSLLDACRTLGVETSPMILDDLGIIPLLSWYHEVIDLLLSTIQLFNHWLVDLSHNFPLFCYWTCCIFQSFDREMDISNIRIPSLEMVIHFPSAFWVVIIDLHLLLLFSRVCGGISFHFHREAFLMCYYSLVSKTFLQLFFLSSVVKKANFKRCLWS